MTKEEIEFNTNSELVLLKMQQLGLYINKSLPDKSAQVNLALGIFNTLLKNTNMESLSKIIKSSDL